jgi:predicted regulator of Ras-like GTPase activity (Roadblock/LC7/MglB family)
VVRRDLLAQWELSSIGRRALLRCAALVFECDVVVWQAFGAAAGSRHLHLLHRFEDALAVTERRVRAAERSRFVNRPAITVIVRNACAAIDDLLGGEVDRADALAVVEDAAVELAVLSVRIATDLDQFGRTRRRHPARPVDLTRRLSRVAREVSGAARVEHRTVGERGEESHLGAWLTAALDVSPTTEALELACDEGVDRSLRADGLLSMRNCWLRVAVALSMIVVELDGLLVVATFRGTPHMERAVAARASHALSAAALCERPCEFDHVHAWASHRKALVGLVGDVCLALQTCDQELMVGTQQLAIHRLARALAAVWAIDERLRRGIQEPSHSPDC